MHESTRHRSRRRTWTRRRIAVIISIAIIYGVWFNFIDTVIYCYNDNNTCKSLGQIFGGDLYYQPWNVIGHIIPGLFLLLYFWSKKEELAIIELFIAGILISTATMDSPLWGVIRLYGHDTPLWHCVPCEPPEKLHNEPTNDLWTWIAYYYNPVGSYGVWVGPIPSAALLFWSVVGRIAAAVVLILWQYRQEKNDKTKSSIKDLISR
ncbi:MAG: hypothetical protein WA364_09365 [Candidatus Nitrosopolaris sp.]